MRLLLPIFALTVPLAAQDTTDPTPFDIEALIAEMTLEQKVGQMTQLTLQAVSSSSATVETPDGLIIDDAKLREAVVDRHVGSLFNSNKIAIPAARWQEVITRIQKLATEEGPHKIPVIYGIDSIHGANYVRDATLFPQALGLAATWNPDLVEQCHAVTARETRATGIPWTFAPSLDVGRQPLWPRFAETLGEDTHLATVLGEHAVRGLQGPDVSDPARVAATGKHFLAYGSPLSGRDRTPVWIPERYLREYFLPPFWNAIDQGRLKAIMVNSAEINGLPVHSNHSILTLLLRRQMAFDGVVVTGWGDIARLHEFHRAAPSMKEAVRLAVDAGIDMAQVPFDYQFTDLLVELVKEGAITEDRIDESVRRILFLKSDLGLFENPLPSADALALINNEEAKALSLQAARESVVLLKNDGTLPLTKTGKILLTGPGCVSRPALHGAWSYTWQGDDKMAYSLDIPNIVDAFESAHGEDNITYVPGTSFDQVIDLDRAVRAAQRVDTIVCVLAEKPATEGAGNIDDLHLPAAQTALVKAVSFGKPLIVIVLSDRPRLITRADSYANATLFASRPGPFGGQALYDILTGTCNPSGKLPFTYPRAPNALLTYDHKLSETPENAAGEPGFHPLYEFGHGLSYTTFRYANLKLASDSLIDIDNLEISVDVTNTGKIDGTETVQVYVRDLYASITPPVKRLRAFRKIKLAAGATETVTFSIPAMDLAFAGPNNKFVLEPGDFEVRVGDQSATFVVVDSTGALPPLPE